jgi:hypothetical protein
VLVLIFSFPSSIHAFDRDYCEFGTNDYSLEWAYEPNTEKIVFVLKLNSTEPEFWTGVGFNGTRVSYFEGIWLKIELHWPISDKINFEFRLAHSILIFHT